MLRIAKLTDYAAVVLTTARRSIAGAQCTAPRNWLHWRAWNPRPRPRC